MKYLPISDQLGGGGIWEGQLSCKGLNRALALPKVLASRFSKPDVILVPNPSARMHGRDQGKTYSCVPPLATVEPAATRLEVSTAHEHKTASGGIEEVITGMVVFAMFKRAKVEALEQIIARWSEGLERLRAEKLHLDTLHAAQPAAVGDSDGWVSELRYEISVYEVALDRARRDLEDRTRANGKRVEQREIVRSLYMALEKAITSQSSMKSNPVPMLLTEYQHSRQILSKIED